MYMHICIYIHIKHITSTLTQHTITQQQANNNKDTAREACCSLLKNINVHVYERSGRRRQTTYIYIYVYT